MAQPSVKTSFASGEWAPKLRSRVDIQKYHSGAALLRNFFVDYSGGGASTRQGSAFVNQVKASGARVIPFQPSTSVSFVLEFGQNYIRFHQNGAPILENAVTGGTAASGNTFTITNTYNTGDWVLANGWGGLTNVNGNYYIVASATGSVVNVTDLNGNPVLFAGAYTSGGQLQRVYTITSPFNQTDLFPNQVTGNPGLKFVQNVTSLIICHPSYTPQQLTVVTATNWTLSSISFGATIPSPAAPTVVTSAAGTTWNYAYVVTAVDVNGQESPPSPPGTVQSGNLINSTATTNTVSWTAVAGASSYNVYKALPAESAIVGGAQYGFIGNVTGTSFQESTPGIAANFALTPPIIESPFIGSGVTSYTVTAAGSYAGGVAVPTVTVATPPSGTRATAVASLGVITVGGITHSGSSDILTTPETNPTGSTLFFTATGVTVVITSVTHVGGAGSGLWNVNSVSLVNPGSITSGTTPANPVAPSGCTVANFNVFGSGFGISFTWGVKSVNPIVFGSGYLTAPAVTISSGGATANAILGPAGGGNPGVPGLVQERLALCGQTGNIQGFNMSQPFTFYNFNTSNPTQATDAIFGSIVSEQLNDIRWLVGVPTGLLAGTGKAAFLLNGGGGISTQNPITPTTITAQPQAFNGVNDLPPIKVNFDLLYSTNKGNYVRDLSYNLYAQIFTGTDISVLSNHLFFGHSLVDWCFAEEPFKTLWATRDDGQMLSLGYVKEQDLIGWAHHDTSGQYKSICSVIETVPGGTVDAVYYIAQRLINGIQVQYVERMADRYFLYGYEDSWSVDCGLRTTPAVSPVTTLTISSNANAVGNVVTLTDIAGAPFTALMATNNWIIRAGGGIYKITAFGSSTSVTVSVVRVPSLINQLTGIAYPVTGYTIWSPTSTVTGLTQLVGQSVVGVADGVAVGPFTVSATGSVTLGLSATKVTMGLAYLPQLQTLPLDLGEPTVQGKRKKIVALTLRVADTLGLSVGKTFQTLTAMKDFILGNIPSTSTGVAAVSDLVSGDGRTILDQQWDEAGNYCVQQNLPYPATILGAFPETIVGDTKG